MSGLVEFKLTGLDALQAQLVALGKEAGAKALAQAAREAFKPVLADAKALVPVNTGSLRDALRLSVVKPKGDDGPAVVVGVVVGAGSKDAAGGKLIGRDELPPARRWHFIELGTAFQAAHPFLRPALRANAAAVLDKLKVEIAKSIQKVLRKRAKAAAK